VSIETMDGRHQGFENVVVGVDGTTDSDRAVRYAVAEAGRTGSRLRLVHVRHETVLTAPMLLLFHTETLRAVGDRILDDAEALVRSIAGHEVEVEKHLLEGQRAESIIEAAGTDPIVLGPRSSHLERLITGSTVAEVAAHARGPVVSVPPAWQPGRVHGSVVVGVDGSQASKAVLEVAFSAAADRGARLVVLHAWRPSAAYDAAIGGRVLAESWELQTEPEIWELVAGLRGDHPEVDVQVVLKYERPEVALVDASRQADLVVVGRRGGERSLGLALGSRARALIQSGRCPVKIAPVPAPRGWFPEQRRAHPGERAGMALDPERR
jgi:nucleotide-binding universal stress UspA family protein